MPTDIDLSKVSWDNQDPVSALFGNESGKARRVIMAESSGNPEAHNKEGGGTGAFGLFQIRGKLHRDALREAGIIKTDQDLLNPEKNVAAAAFLKTKYGWNPWSESKGKWDKPSKIDESKVVWNDIPQAKAAVGPATAPEPTKQDESLYSKAAPYIRNTLEGGGMLAGGAVGAASGLLTGPGAPVASPVGAVAGGALGYATGKRVADIIDQFAGAKKTETLGEALVNTGKDVVEGAAYEMGGQVAGKAIPALVKGAGRVTSEILGSATGSGRGAIQGSIRGGKSFEDAMRGNISGDEIATNARDAIQVIKDKRADAYLTKLSSIEKSKVDLDQSPIQNKLRDLMRQYGVKVDPEGIVDVSRVKMGEKGKRDIQKMIERVWDQGTQPGDKTAMGLDGLKRELDDFYSDSSQARAFVSSLRKTVKDTIVRNVPEYAEMTKGYSQATQLIKDIESGLMLKKNGLSGRVTADNTLRRLTSAMRENFEMRKDLLEELTKGSSVDVMGQVAGYAMNQAIPHGLVGKLGSGGALIYLNPKMWPLVAAASPRVMGEFLNVYGKSLRFAAPVKPVATEMAKKFSTPAAMVLTNSDNDK